MYFTAQRMMGASTLSFNSSRQFPLYSEDSGEMRDSLFVASNVVRTILSSVWVSGKLTESDI